MVITVIMCIVTIFIVRYYLGIWGYGDDSNFYLVGKWTAGIAGLFVSIILGVVCLAVNTTIALPLICFIYCLIWLYVYSSPIIIINGNHIRCVSFKGAVECDKSEMRFYAGYMHIGEKSFYIRNDSINYDRFVNWLNA